ncbi:MAG: hypothetical protein ACXAC5_04815 [Promethearchaeota archaeon]|jgi:hypothetical protein
MDKNVKQIYKIILGNNGFGIHNKSSPLETVMFPNGDVAFRYDVSSTGLPPNWEVLILSKNVSREKLEKEYPLLTMFGKLK